MTEKLSKAGYSQGNMAPKVENYQAPEAVFADKQEGKTTSFISKENERQKKGASKLKSMSYKGRYD